MAEDSDDKTEEPSGRKLEQAREKGQLGRSQDFSSAIVLLAGVAAIASFGDDFTEHSKDLMREFFASISKVGEPTDEWFSYLGGHVLTKLLDMLWPILVILMITGLAVNIVQVGLNFTTKPLELELKKVFNMSSLKNLFGKNAFIELLKGLAKMAIIGYISYDAIQQRLEEVLTTAGMDLNQIVAVLIDISFEILWKVILLLLVLGIADWAYQKRKTHNDLKMTKQEVKDETKNTQGDPKVLAQRKRAMYKMHQQFMMKEVPKATVVITNPTFIAIAIRYERGKDSAPIVLAKGKRLIAERIRELAKEGGVPIVENRLLARGMYDQVQPGDTIPQDFFAAVAEVLAYVFTMDQRKAAKT